MALSRSKRIFCDDDGMTILEIMISAVIFFIVLTGILGLVGTTTEMSIQAKEKTVMTNAINSYVERVQAMDFDEVTTDGETPLSVETTTVGEFTVQITPTVRSYTVGGETVTSLKHLDITVTVTSSRGKVLSKTTTVTIRDRSELMSQGVSDPATDPTISWGTNMPSEGSVVYDHYWWENGELYIDFDATASEGRTIARVEVAVNSRLLQTTGLDPDEAVWYPGTTSFSTDMTFVWNTLQTYVPSGETTPTLATGGDGEVTLTAWVYDSENAYQSVTRYLLVDNVAPSSPSTPEPTVNSDILTTLSWDEVWDGQSPTDHYDTELYLESGSLVASYETAVPILSIPTEAFTRYNAQVRSASPRFDSAYTAVASSWCSRPRVTGTYSVPSNRRSLTVALACTPPNFSVSEVSYLWERIQDGVPTPLASTGPTAADTWSGSAPPPARYYRCTVTYTPSGGAEYSIASNTVGPTPISASSGAFSEGTW